MGRQRKAQLARKIADMRTALCIVDDVGAAPVAYPIYRLTPGAFRELVRMACMYADAHSSSSSSATEKSYGSWLTTHTTWQCHLPCSGMSVMFLATMSTPQKFKRSEVQMGLSTWFLESSLL
jgi:hypothetical protein